MFFNTLAIVGALAGSTLAAADGLLCVDETLRLIFDQINDVRENGASSDAGVKLNTNNDAWDDSTHAYWTMDDGTNQAIISGGSYLADAVTAVDGMSAIDAFEWVEGLANSSGDAGVDYTTNDNTSVTGTDGSTTSTRANAYGSWAGGIVEYVFEIEFSTAVSADDVVQALLIGDGDSNNVARTAITDGAYTKIGISATENSSTDHVFYSVVFA